MNKRRYVLLLAVGILTVAITGGVIFAQNNNSQQNVNSQIGNSPEGLTRQISSFDQGKPGQIDLSHGDAPKQSMASRVAVILGLEEEVVQNAFAQAGREKQDDSMAYRLGHLVENEKLTQTEADEILDWFFTRPDAAAKLHRVLLRSGEGVERKLNHMVERGIISQEEADEILAWHGEMPQALKDLQAEKFHRGADSKSWGQFQPSERFQGRDMDRTGFEGRRFDREGFSGRSFRRGGMWGGMQSHMTEGAHGLDPAGAQ